MIAASRSSLNPKLPRRKPSWVRSGAFTYDDFAAMIHDGDKADLIDGAIYMASPDNTENAELQVWLLRLLAEFVDIYQLGTVYGSRVAYRLDDKNSPEPDISFVPVQWKSKIKRGRVEGPPALAIEVVSPDSAQRDYEQKLLLYQSAGVLEYWIIDPDEQKASFFIRKGQSLVPGKVIKHLWHSIVLKGLTLDIRWLWSPRRPRIFDVLRPHYYPENNGS